MKKKIISLILCIAMIFSMLTIVAATSASAEEDAAVQEYEIYPVPQSVVYNGGTVNVPKSVSLALTDSLDEATVKKIKEVLDNAGISYDESEITYALGDVDHSGVINAADAVLVLQRFADIIDDEDPKYDASLADVNNDGNVNASDAVEILQDFAGIKKIGEGTPTAYAAGYTVSVSVKGEGANEPEADNGFFDNRDAYILTIDDNAVTIVGKDTDAAYFGVVTLKWILEQCGSTMRTLRIEDYSDAGTRGFIEGYYGIPWSDEDRISLMEFGGNVKMTTYVFAPKNDPYHSSLWTQLYPQERLEEMKAMVQAGIDSKCRFVWTIHPFMHNQITVNDYDTKLEIVKAKFEQLYSIGVRQFGILADDASSNVAIQRQLCVDMTKWCEDKGDCYDLIFCPQSYNYAWTSINANGTSNYFDSLMDGMPESVQICWTGNSVCGAAEQSAFDRFTHLTGREALMWINWPCNDINSKRVLMGRGELLKEGVTGFCGIIANPMQQAEPSKVALFAIADYTWNRSGWNMDKSWVDSFKYVEPQAYEALYTMAKHLSDPSPNTHGENLTESEQINPLLTEFTTKYNAGESVKEVGARLIDEMDIIIEACDDFDENASVTALHDQLQPWTDSLRYLANAIKNYILTAIAFEDENEDDIWGYYSIAYANYSASQNCPVEILDSVNGTNIFTKYTIAQAGSKRLIPFTESLAAKLAADVLAIVNPSAALGETIGGTIIKSDDFISVYQGNEANITDGNSSTYCWYRTRSDTVAADGYIGLDLGAVKNIGKINVIQGSSAAANDIFTNAVLEYSADGENYTTVKTVTSSDASASLETPVKARYVRLRTLANTAKWYSISEFTVTLSNVEATVNPATVAYTNVATLASAPVTYTNDTAVLSSLGEITLAPGKYVGVALTRIKAVDNVTVNGTNVDALTVEYSMNGVEWTAERSDARYVRLINKTESDVTATVDGITVHSDEISEISVVENTLGAGGNPLYALDGDLSTIAEFRSSQANGKHVIYDLGQTVSVDSLKFVMYDGENDYVRNGIVAISANGTDWQTVITLGNGTTNVEMSDIYTHDVAYYIAENSEVGGTAVRYIKVELTSGPGSADKWTAFSEIVINNGAERATTTDPTFVQNPAFYTGKTVYNLVDSDVNTTYVPKTADSSVIYHVSEDCDIINGITILQNPLTISNATVSVRTADNNWEEIGTLSASLNKFEALDYENILDIKIEWEKVIPELHEMFIYTEQRTSSVDKFALTELIAQASEYKENNYTAESYADLVKAINAAQGVVNFVNATEQDVTDATAQLNAAITALVAKVADKTELAAIIAEAKALTENEYTANSWSAMKTALAAAEAANNSTDTLYQGECDDLVAALREALDWLVMTGTQTKIASSDLTGYSPTSHSGEGPANAVDGNTGTVWHTPWASDSGTKPVIAEDGTDNYYIITLNENKLVNKLEYVTRASQQNGNITGYKLYYSETLDGDDFIEVRTSSSDYGVWTAANGTKTIEFVQVNARRLKLVAISTAGDTRNDYICAAEFNVYQLTK